VNGQLVLFRESQYTPSGVIRGIRYRVIFSTNNAPLRGENSHSWYMSWFLPTMHP